MRVFEFLSRDWVLQKFGELGENPRGLCYLDVLLSGLHVHVHGSVLSILET